MELKHEDYREPVCPFNTEQWTEPERHIPVDRIIRRLDEELTRGDFAAGEKLLAYWLKEAQMGRDERGEFSVRNELMGLSRKLGHKDDAYGHAERALEIIDRLDIGETVSAATAYINAATVYKAFGEAERAVPLFERARAVYEKELAGDDGRLGGLYNNMALALADLKRYREADGLYRKALSVMEKTEHGEIGQAITWLNIASAAAAERGLDARDEIAAALDKAAALFDAPELTWDGDYAFACEKCAPVFGGFGYADVEKDLLERAAEIHEGA